MQYFLEKEMRKDRLRSGVEGGLKDTEESD